MNCTPMNGDAGLLPAEHLTFKIEIDIAARGR
jgi:hypothetical protein